MAPYYTLPWFFPCWYVSEGEFNWFFNNTNGARFKSIKFQPNIVGYRTHFMTGSDASEMVNSQMDTQLDFFRGIEKWAPFRTTSDVDGDNPPMWNGTLSTIQLAKKLYGDSSAQTELPATQVYRQFHCRPVHFVDEAKNASGRGPDYANIKAGSVNLKNFNGPLTTIEYTTKNGIFHHGGPNLHGCESTKRVLYDYPFTDKLIDL